MSPDWPRVSKNERHGYEESEAAAPSPAPELTPIQMERNQLMQQVAHLQAELDAIKKRRAEIAATWGHVEGKIGCQCPICQRDFNAFMDAFEESDMQLNLPGGYKDRAEQAEARCRVLEEALRKLVEIAKAGKFGVEPDVKGIRTLGKLVKAVDQAERALAGQEEK